MWFTAFLFALAFALGGTILDAMSSKSRTGTDAQIASTVIAGVLTFGVIIFTDWAILYTSTPSFAGVGFLALVMPNLFVTLILFGLANGVTERLSLAPVAAGLAIIGLLATLVLWNEWPLKGASDVYGHQIHPTVEEATAYPPTSNENIVRVGPQTAYNKANQVMGQTIPDEKKGNGAVYTLGSRYQLADCVRQSVRAHMYYICSLQLSGTVNNRADKYTVPGYIVVDALDPEATPRFFGGYKMVLTYGAPYGHSMTRHIYNNGYDNVYVDDPTFEVDDNWRPYYTASIDTPGARWQQSVPRAFITADPQTGAITRYPLTRIPAWVDRVYSADMAKMMLNWWGDWGVVPWTQQGSGGRFKVDGDVTLVYTDRGPAWQALLTSYNTDTSVTYVALFNARDKNDVRLYKVPQGLTIQSTVVHAIHNASTTTKRDPAELSLHRINGVLLWVAPLIPFETLDTENPLDHPEPSSGLALLNATDPNPTDVIIGEGRDSKADALNKLAMQIASGSNNNAPGATALKKEVTGKIASVNVISVKGQSSVVIMLEGDSSHIYTGELTGDDISNLEMSLAAKGDTVTIGFVDGGSPIRNISSYTVVNGAGAAIKASPSPAVSGSPAPPPSAKPATSKVPVPAVPSPSPSK